MKRPDPKSAADEFDISRDGPRHCSFGGGIHFCLGSHLARLELRIIFEELIPRLRNPKLAGEITYMRNFFISTIKAMPITFNAATDT